MSPDNSKEKDKQIELVAKAPAVHLSDSNQAGNGSDLNQTGDDSNEDGILAMVEAPRFGERYQMIESLGEGGMGRVYKVYDPELDKHFAVKVLRRELAEDLQSVRRFEQEIKAASELNHLNLVPVYGHGKTETGIPYLVMDYVKGETLCETLTNEKKLPVERGLDLFIQTCEALIHAHMKGLVHRDLKPSNIMLTKTECGADVVHVLDFGIAKILPSEGMNETRTNLTQTSAIFGSPLYMSPEQCENNAQDARSDIYALGCVMYETLSGVQPFKAENPVRIILKHLTSDPKPISSLPDAKDIPRELETIVLKCLEKAPDDRYQTVDALLRDLRLVAQGKPISTKLRSKKKQTATLAQKVLLVCCAVAIVVLSTLIGNELLMRNNRIAPADDDPYAPAVQASVDTYMGSAQYERAAALLEGECAAGRERVDGIKPMIQQCIKTGNKQQEQHYIDTMRSHEFRLAEDLQKAGKCFLLIAARDEQKGKAATAVSAYEKAYEKYRESIEIYQKYGELKPPYAQPTIREYATVLQKLGKAEEFNALKQFSLTQDVHL